MSAPASDNPILKETQQWYEYTRKNVPKPLLAHIEAYTVKHETTGKFATRRKTLWESLLNEKIPKWRRHPSRYVEEMLQIVKELKIAGIERGEGNTYNIRKTIYVDKRTKRVYELPPDTPPRSPIPSAEADEDQDSIPSPGGPPDPAPPDTGLHNTDNSSSQHSDDSKSNGWQQITADSKHSAKLPKHKFRDPKDEKCTFEELLQKNRYKLRAYGHDIDSPPNVPLDNNTDDDDEVKEDDKSPKMAEDRKLPATTPVPDISILEFKQLQEQYDAMQRQIFDMNQLLKDQQHVQTKSKTQFETLEQNLQQEIYDLRASNDLQREKITELELQLSMIQHEDKIILDAINQHKQDTQDFKKDVADTVKGKTIVMERLERSCKEDIAQIRTNIDQDINHIQDILNQFKANYEPTKISEIMRKVNALYDQFGPLSTQSFNTWIEAQSQAAINHIDARKVLFDKDVAAAEDHLERTLQSMKADMDTSSEVYIDEIQDHMEDFRHLVESARKKYKLSPAPPGSSVPVGSSHSTAPPPAASVQSPEPTPFAQAPPEASVQSPAPTVPPHPVPPTPGPTGAHKDTSSSSIPSPPVFMNKYPITNPYHNHANQDHHNYNNQGNGQSHTEKMFLYHHRIEASLTNLDEDQMRQFYRVIYTSCQMFQIPLRALSDLTPLDNSIVPSHLSQDQRIHYSKLLAVKWNQQPNLFGDPVIQNMAFSKTAQEDGYGALQILLYESIPSLQNSATKQASTNDKPAFDASRQTIYSYEALLLSYYDLQAKRQRLYTDQEKVAAYLNALQQDSRFTAAVYTLQKDLQAYPHNSLPSEYQLGNIGFKVSQLAQANGEVGTDALKFIQNESPTTPHVRNLNDTNIQPTKAAPPTTPYATAPTPAQVNSVEETDEKKPSSRRRGRYNARPRANVQCGYCGVYGHYDHNCDLVCKVALCLKAIRDNDKKIHQMALDFQKKHSEHNRARAAVAKALLGNLSHPILKTAELVDPSSDDEDDDQDVDYFPQHASSTILMDILDGITGKAAVISAPEAQPRLTHSGQQPLPLTADHNLQHSVDPNCMQMVQINPIPSIIRPTSTQDDPDESVGTPVMDNTTSPSIKSIFSPSLDPTTTNSLTHDQRYAQVDPGANRSLTDSAHLLRNFQTIEPYPVGSVNSSAPCVCEGIGSFPTTTDQGSSMFYTMLHCDQSSGTIVAPDPKVVQTDGLHSWVMRGFPSSEQGTLEYYDKQGNLVASQHLIRHNGLYYLKHPISRPNTTHDTRQNQKNHQSLSKAHFIHCPDYEPILKSGHGHYNMMDMDGDDFTVQEPGNTPPLVHHINDSSANQEAICQEPVSESQTPGNLSNRQTTDIPDDLILLDMTGQIEDSDRHYPPYEDGLDYMPRGLYKGAEEQRLAQQAQAKLAARNLMYPVPTRHLKTSAGTYIPPALYDHPLIAKRPACDRSSPDQVHAIHAHGNPSHICAPKATADRNIDIPETKSPTTPRSIHPDTDLNDKKDDPASQGKMATQADPDTSLIPNLDPLAELDLLVETITTEDSDDDDDDTPPDQVTIPKPKKPPKPELSWTYKPTKKPDPPAGPLRFPNRQWSGNSPPTPKVPKARQPKSKPTASQLDTELWHMRLAHPGLNKLKQTAKHVRGIPRIKDLHPLFECDGCTRGKMTKSNRGQPEIQQATHPAERFHMDFGFMRGPASLQPNKRKTRYGNIPAPHDHKPIITSHDGFNSYLLIVDAYTRVAWVFLTKSKQPPIDTLTTFMNMYARRDNMQRYVRTDQGGELANSQEFKDLMMKHGYLVEPTGSDSSDQNGRGERPHRTLANMVRCMLFSAEMGAEFWSDCLLHAVYLYNRSYHVKLDKTPYEAWTGVQPDLSHLKIFGSYVTSKKPGHRPTKITDHTFSGRFLRFTATNKNIVYWDHNTNQVKTARHADQDEVHYASPKATRPKQFDQLITLAADEPHKEQHGQAQLVMQQEFQDSTFEDVPNIPITAAAAKVQATRYPSPYLDMLHPYDPIEDPTTPAIHTVIETPSPNVTLTNSDILNIEMSNDVYGPSSKELLPVHATHPTLGFDLLHQQLTAKPTIKNCKSGTPAARIKNWRSRYRHGTIRAINGDYIDTVQDLKHKVQQLQKDRIKQCTVTIAHPEIAEPLTNDGIPQLHFDQLHMLAHHLHVIRHGEENDLWIDKTKAPPLDEATIHQAIADNLTSMKFTRKKLKTRNDWQTWLEAEWKQLDAYEKQEMFGAPCPKPSGKQVTVLPFVWTYLFKDGITHKARATCNGGPRYGKAVTLAHTYASCIEQPAARIFWALSAIDGMTVIGADAGNAFAEAPPPQQTFYMKVDAAFNQWWTEKQGRPPIPPGYVLPVQHALQGHPESPRLWERFITNILQKEGFKNTTHEKNIYSATIQGHKVLFLRQVDDFAVACKEPSIARALIAKIGTYLSVPLHDLGIVSKFNGINVQQARDFIKISCETFLDKVLDHHGWQETTEQHKPIPMRDDSTYLAQLEIAEEPTPKEQAQLREEFFNYRQVIGEAIYAMTVARPDISPAVIKLAQYSNNPAKIHYQALRHLMKYLALTKTRGIHFWRKKPVPELPYIEPEPCIADTEIMHTIPQTKQPRIIHGYVDSDWGSDRKHRKSVTGIAIMLGGGVICYKTKFQVTVALSSTEAEFTAACEAGKQILYIRSILNELGYPQDMPTVLYEDNRGALHMANAARPTKRTRHMDFKHFAIQDWTEHDLLVMAPIATKHNCGDSFTKALGRIKFYEQTDVLMGRRIPAYSPQFSKFSKKQASLPQEENTTDLPPLTETITSLLPTCSWLTAAAA